MKGLIGNREKGMMHLGSMHGGPKKGEGGRSYCPDPVPGPGGNEKADTCCIHITPGFLPWHRLYMTQMEDALGMALPYWDWTANGQIPDLWEGLNATFRDGVKSDCLDYPGRKYPTQCHQPCKNGGDPGLVNRRENVDIAPDKRESIQLAFDQPDFDRFEPMLKVPHDLAHIEIACEMSKEQTAGYDPIFFLHHTFVDYQFAFWQEVNRIREALL